MDRVRVIERSLRCYHAGWWGLIPVLGLVPAALAFWLFWSVRDEVGEDWNPAAAYLRWGLLLATIGLVVSMCVVAVPLLELLF